MRERFRKLLQSERGNVLILVAAGMVAMFGFAAISLDAASLYMARSRAQSAADAAAMAAAQYLPSNPSQAESTADMVAFNNGIDPSLIRVQFSSDYKSVTVGTGKVVNFNFAQVLGFDQSQVGATATAHVSYLSSFLGIAPMAILRSDFVPYQSYTLRSSDSVSPGNYMALDLPDPNGGNNGADNYYNELVGGWDTNAYIGQALSTETGYMTQKTQSAVQNLITLNPDDLNGDGIPDYQQDLNNDGYPDIPTNSPRLLKIPMTDSFPNGTSSQITVVGFATFYVTGVSSNGKSVYGMFLPAILHGDASDTAPDGGARTIKLVN